jgi:tetratricopeptide (TPR) repeat protein
VFPAGDQEVDIQWARQIEHLLCNGQQDLATAQVNDAVSAAPTDAYVAVARSMLFFYTADWQNALAATTTALEAAHATDDKLAEAFAHTIRAGVFGVLGPNDKYLPSATAALDAARNAGDKVAEAYALSTKAVALSRAGRQAEAIQSAATAVDVARSAGDKYAEAMALFSQTSALATLGRNEELLHVTTTALGVARVADNKYLEAAVLQSQTVALIMLGRNEEALQAATAAAEAARAAKNWILEATMLATQASVFLALGRNEESLQTATAAVEVARTIDVGAVFANAVSIQALALTSLNRHQEAIQAVAAAGDAAATAGIEALALNSLNRHQEALQAAAAAAKAAATAGNKLAETNALNIQAALHMLDHHAESLQLASSALAAARAVNYRIGEVTALNIQAVVLRMLDRHEESLQAATIAAEVAGAAGIRAAEATAIANKVAALCEMGRTEDRKTALEALAVLDPDEGKRLATLPVRPGWFRMCRRILAKKIDREKNLRKVLESPAIVPERPDGFLGEFRVLRNWASYTTVDLMRPPSCAGDPSSTHAGGGYFLWWQGWGLVIDPGLGFGEAYRAAGFVPRNISAVAATHHHIDHTGDMLPILTCVFEMNQERTTLADTDSPVDFLLAPGAFSAFAGVAAYVPGVRSVRLLRPKESTELALPRNAKATVIAVKAKHRDLTGREDAAIGLRVDLATADGKRCCVGISGDTRLTKEAAEAFKDVDLMIVHIGSIYEADLGTDSSDLLASIASAASDLLASTMGASKYPNRVHQPEPSSWHLGFSGTVELLREIKKHSKEDWDPLVLVSEWGEELGPDRSEICKAVAQSAEIGRVFPAAWNQGIALAAGQAKPICARRHGKIADHWHDNQGCIEYLCNQHDHRSTSQSTEDSGAHGGSVSAPP